MKVVFVSNYFNHHQQAFCDEMNNLLGNNFLFISTSEMREDRRKLGYGISEMPSYVKEIYLSDDEYVRCCGYIDNADIVIAGSVSEKLLKTRIKNNKLTFRYQERLFKSNIGSIKFFINAFLWFIRNPKNKNIHLLCASAYTSADYSRLGLFKSSSYKWGYFPKTIAYDIDDMISKKDKTKILWCGRLIPYKHPEHAIELAARLRDSGCNFSLDFIGIGEMEIQLKLKVDELNLNNYVNFLGANKPERVRNYMENSSIFIFTSNFDEGWGAVLNEAMNSGCAVVASHAIGSVPYLLENGANGLVYENDNIDDLYNKVKSLLDNPDRLAALGINAYYTVNNLWNAKVAAERFLKLVDEITKYGHCDLFDCGPCSKAQVIKNNWFKEE